MSFIDADPTNALREPGLPLVVRRLLPGSVIAAFTVWMLAPLGDPDSLWHILAGQRLLETGEFVQADTYSPATTAPWVLHQWLPEMAMALLERAFGLPGVAWGHTLVLAGLGTTLWWALRRSAGLLPTSLVIIVATLGMSAGLTARPQIVSFVLLVVVTDAWLRTAHDGIARWWLIPLSWVWACSHGLWVVGPVVGLAVIAGLAMERTLTLRHTARLSLIPLGSVVVALLTPLGPALLTSIVAIREVAPLLNEWQPAPPTNPAFIAAGVLVALPLMVSVRARTPMPWSQILLLVIAAGSILLFGRTIAVGAGVAAPIAAEALQRSARLRRERVAAPEIALTAGLVVAALAATAFFAPRRAAEPDIGPTGLNSALQALPAGTVVCNDDAIGGWLLWEHSHLRPTLDTRMEVYGAEHLHAFLTFHATRPGWEDYLTDTGCTVSLLRINAPVNEALTERRAWHVIDSDEEYVLLEAPSKT